jgi:hypothetical protein
MKKSMIMGAAALFAAGVAQAAVITWGAATTVAGETDVSTQGALTYAESWGLAAANVNGVDFALVDGVNITRSDGVTDRTTTRTDNVPLTLTQSGSYYDMLRSNWYSADAGKTITMNNLVSGQEYLVQIWSSDDRYNSTQQEWIDGEALQTNIGQFKTGTFTADATTQSITIGPALSGSNSGILNAMQVRAIPEPATLGLIGFFGGGLLFVRRRFMM